MAPTLELSIPSTTISTTSKPYTLYTISLRLPLRSYNLSKRFSDFLTLHDLLTQTAGAPPVSPPPKTWFKSSTTSPELTETRRQALEQYLQTINTHGDPRWRNTPVWRAFLNLPSTFSGSSNNNISIAATKTIATDPTVWLDNHRELKQQLHIARLALTTRDQAATPQGQHEASANAKTALVKANSLIASLDAGLGELKELGAGEARRRKDLLAAARKDHSSLETLLNAMAQKTKLDNAVANVQDKSSLLDVKSSSSGSKPRGRVLGKETNETRELDNEGVVQLQKQKMKDQDMDVDELRKIILRQRELGVAINNELEIHNEMLKMVDEDVDRVQGKIDVAKKRIAKIH